MALRVTAVVLLVMTYALNQLLAGDTPGAAERAATPKRHEGNSSLQINLAASNETNSRRGEQP